MPRFFDELASPDQALVTGSQISEYLVDVLEPGLVDTCTHLISSDKSGVSHDQRMRRDRLHAQKHLGQCLGQVGSPDRASARRRSRSCR
jgi:hypothetical protein